jgi:hypothetical protein
MGNAAEEGGLILFGECPDRTPLRNLSKKAAP